MDPVAAAGGSKLWFVADGYLPLQSRSDHSGFEGHEAIMILNCGDRPARVLMDIYFEDREPISTSPLPWWGQQYALRFRSDVEVIVQYGRMDIAQDNLAYIGMMGHPG